MSETYGPGIELEGEPEVNKDDFNATAVDEEVRADALCQKLLKRFYVALMEEGMSPQEATEFAGSADYFARDFVIGYKHRNLFDERPGIVRQFAATWYIINTIEPEIAQLGGHLRGVRAFYRFLLDRGLISQEFFAAIERECNDIAYYDGRIGSFWEIKGDGYGAWEKECSLKGD